jgi:hypothetical protein
MGKLAFLAIRDDKGQLQVNTQSGGLGGGGRIEGGVRGNRLARGVKGADGKLAFLAIRGDKGQLQVNRRGVE